MPSAANYHSERHEFEGSRGNRGPKRKALGSSRCLSNLKRHENDYNSPRVLVQDGYIMETTNSQHLSDQSKQAFSTPKLLLQCGTNFMEKELISCREKSEGAEEHNIDMDERCGTIRHGLESPVGHLGDSFCDSDMSCRSSTTGGWSAPLTTTSRRTSHSSTANDEYPLLATSQDETGTNSAESYVYEGSCAEPIPFSLSAINPDNVDMNVDFNRTEEEVQPSGCVGDRESTIFQQRLDSQSDTIADGITRPSSPVSSSSRDSLQASSEGDEDSSTHGGNSSQSHTSSKVSDSALEEKPPEKDPNTLAGVLNDVLRTEPLVAELLFHSLNGKLECAPRSPSTKLDTGNPLSMLNLLTIQDPTPVQHRGAFTFATTSDSDPSSSSSYSPSSDNAIGPENSLASSSSNEFNSLGSPNNAPEKDLAEDNNLGQSLKQHNGKPKSSSEGPANIQSFRCFHNVSFPETFCVNHETREQYRSCGGPGWNTFQHLKDHIKSHHTKKVDSLKCGDCQEDFENKRLLKIHKDTVDCDICCPDCRAKFPKKALRTVHQKEKHPEGSRPSAFKELDEAAWKRLGIALDTFSKSTRKGKAPQDSNLTKWVEENTERYMIGRATSSNPTLELGQWYTAFFAIGLQEHIPEHPFYDYLRAADLAEERIRLIWRKLVLARITIYKQPPPSDLPSQLAWYEDALGQALQLAGRTQLKMNGKPPANDDSTIAMDCTQVLAQQAVYSPQVPLSSGDLSAKSEMMIQSDTMLTPRTQQLTMMNQQISGMGPLTQNFYGEENSHQGSMMPRMNGDMSATTPNNMVPTWDTAPANVHPPGGPIEFSYAPQPQGFNAQYGMLNPSMMENSQGLWEILPRDQRQ